MAAVVAVAAVVASAPLFERLEKQDEAARLGLAWALHSFATDEVPFLVVVVVVVLDTYARHRNTLLDDHRNNLLQQWQVVP